MNCNEYQNLTPLERTKFIGQLVHASISGSKYFKMATKLIENAHKEGLFNGVVINPEVLEDNNELNHEQ